MERPNFYQLLELSLNPPVNDSKVIEEAIQKKQEQWSKLRNHPTKATTAQKYIGLLSEIRKVMLDPELRKKEVLAAKHLLIKQEHEKFWKVDRHLGILFSKGHVTDKEIAKLAVIHNIAEDKISARVKEAEKFWKTDRQIGKLLSSKGKIDDKKIAALSKQSGIPDSKLRDRIVRKEEGVFKEVDKYLTICMNRGYITIEEIRGLARLQDISEDRILKRIKCAIRKKSKDKEQKPEPLDSTIEQLIDDKLKIVRKKDLYDFLEILADSGLENLQNKAKEKEAEVRKIGTKDAVTTASGALAGHCVATFQTQESRNSYDLSIIRKRLRQIDSDIEAVESDGKIHGEYINALMKMALRLGTSPDDAEAYIRDYINRKKWIIGQSPQQKKLRMMIAAGAGAGVVLIILIIAGIFLVRSMHVSSDYNKAVASAEKQTVFEEKEKALKEFIKEHGKNNSYSPQIDKKIVEVQNLIKKRDFDAAVKEAEKLLSSPQEIEKAVAVFEQYLKKYPDSIYGSEAKQKISQLKEQADDRDFASLQSFQGDYTEKMKIGDGYFQKYPKGRHTEDVKKIISSMLSGYYNQFKKELGLCDQKEDWETCIDLCGKFIEKFTNSQQASEVEGLRIRFQKNKQNREDLANLKQKAQALGENYEAAKPIFSEYISGNPESPPYMKKLIEGELIALDKQIARRDREKKEWENLISFCKTAANSTGAKIQKLESYITANPTIKYVEDAKKILQEFKKEKAVEDERLKAEKEVKDWQELFAYSRNAQISLADRIRKTETYLSQNASGKYADQAKEILAKLQQEKAIHDERLRASESELARRTAAMRNIQTLLKQSGGRFVDNGNATVTDTKTGLMWSMLDSSAEVGKCLNYLAAEEYVKNLKTGGHSDWRLPNVNELAAIYKNQPFFPSSDQKFFWSADSFWHGWNKRIYIVSSTKETNWSRQDTDTEQCGVVHAVRRR